MPKLPPYAKNIPDNQKQIIILTGSDAWSRVPDNGWIEGDVKTLLPLGDDITAYRWNFVSGKEVIIFSRGQKIEPYERLVELSRELLRYGALSVTLCVGPLLRRPTRFISKEATS